jgi:hypothetical protein
VDERHILLPQAIARVRNVLAEYRRAAEEAGAGRTLAFATSAVRDAENGEAFLGEIEWSYAFKTRPPRRRRGGAPHLSRSDPPGATSRRERLSSTLAAARPSSSSATAARRRFYTSLDLGLRPPHRALRHRLRRSGAHVRDMLAGSVPAEVRPRAAIGVAGTIHDDRHPSISAWRKKIPTPCTATASPPRPSPPGPERLEGMSVEEIRAPSRHAPRPSAGNHGRRR